MRIRGGRTVFTFNAFLALCVAFTAIVLGNQEISAAQRALYPFTIAIILQESVIIQYSFREENSIFTERINQHFSNIFSAMTWKIGKSPILNLALCVVVFLSLVMYASISNQGLSSTMYLRILCISVSIVLILDPLSGLLDKSVPELLSGSFTYCILILFGFNGLIKILGSLQSSFSWPFEFIGITVFTIFILRLRWAYYQLFCFENQEHLVWLVLSVIIPMGILILPLLPDYFGELQSLIWGVN